MTPRKLAQTAGFPVAGASLAISNALHHLPWGIGIFLVCGVAATAANWVEDHTQDAARYRTSLEATLLVLRDNLGFGTTQVRCCLWAPVTKRRRTCLRQITEYVPGPQGKLGREMQVSQGIVGQAFRSGKTELEILDAESVTSPAVFQSQMVRRWGYTQHEAAALTADRRAYLAAPVLGADERVLGIVYFDTADPADFAADDLMNRVDDLVPFLSQWLVLK